MGLARGKTREKSMQDANESTATNLLHRRRSPCARHRSDLDALNTTYLP